MKQGIHPVYVDTIFEDASSNFRILTRTTMQAKDTGKWEDGKEYPLIKLDISSGSHPFFTGQQRLVDTEGRVERFNKKFQKK